MDFPAPHGDKLRALLGNHKLPAGDRPGVHTAIERYEAWIEELRRIEGAGENLVEPMVEALNRYKLSIDLDLVFDSKNDFLYRQKGQLKLDNTVLEEFMPWLVRRVLAGRLAERELTIGPANAFAQLRFDSDLRRVTRGGDMAVRSKDHDFVLARPLYLKASHRRDFEESREARTHLAYVAAEIKTNLDKTMFQEASATAHDLKIALPGSRYFLLCEWLDMIPISSAATAIEQVIVLRKARRLRADVRGQFARLDGRTANRAAFERHLTEHPSLVGSPRKLVGLYRKRIAWEDGAIREPAGAVGPNHDGQMGTGPLEPARCRTVPRSKPRSSRCGARQPPARRSKPPRVYRRIHDLRGESYGFTVTRPGDLRVAPC